MTASLRTQQLAAWLRGELQEFTRVLRLRRDRASLLAAADQLRAAVQTVEAAVRDLRQRYHLPQEEQWGFVSAFAFVQEAKQELKPFLSLRE
jgi:cell division protein FtsB